MITLENWEYELVTDFREGFEEEALLARYSDVLLKYDYILGDWGYGQLRLKGFFDDRNQKRRMKQKSAHCKIICMNTVILAVPISF